MRMYAYSNCPYLEREKREEKKRYKIHRRSIYYCVIRIFIQ